MDENQYDYNSIGSKEDLKQSERKRTTQEKHIE